MIDEHIIPNMMISPTLTSLLDQFTEPYAIRDRYSRTVYANEPMLRIYKVCRKDDVVGKLDKDVQSSLMAYDNVPDEWAMQDRYVINTKESMSFLEVHPRSQDYPYIITKLPYYNDEGLCSGTVAIINVLTTYCLDDFITGDLPSSMLLTKPDDFFTEKECEIMFYRIQGMKSKDVAQKLGLSENTICNYMQSLYYKTGARQLEGFKLFCKGRNYHRYLPKRFLSHHVNGYSNLIT
ncbi:LuxR C-terminal-related transcriptional regulator [Acerihabitans sp. TG2]|uniref:LuxR C-terminal-related transcriptional regulator n=1 Tax=Acerihabitans sp. TG2 TaxID=3096008 RepID=UPI002B235F83|nr:LuxR C-terminal-related transcriptional regulator [Acerihabitans sp. TG2]MEA9389093.1 LuxR C-terminal-related transcriptional regulator [Acerihabitans sp. TG2]